MDVTIYSLSDPRNGDIRYVGKTMNPNFRLRGHISEKSTNHKCCWIRSLLKLGIRPSIEPLEVIENSNDEDWQESERFWINYLRFLGCKLTNIEDGGMRGKKLTLETKLKISAANKGKTSWRKGKKMPLETKLKIGAANKGRPPWHKGLHLSDAHKASLSKMQSGRIRSSETKAKLSLAKSGVPLSEEHKAKISAANRGRIVSESTRYKISKSHIGIGHSPESRAKISASLLGSIPWNKGLKLK